MNIEISNQPINRPGIVITVNSNIIHTGDGRGGHNSISAITDAREVIQRLESKGE